VVVEAVDFARHGARFTRDVEDLVAWLATRMDKTAVCRLCRINATPGHRGRRSAPSSNASSLDELDPHRLDDLYEIGIDEISCAPRGAGVPSGAERAPPLVVAATGRS
jgi:hypothetical protein